LWDVGEVLGESIMFIARMLNRFCHIALVVLALYLGWAIVGDRPFVVASTYVSHFLARNSADRARDQADDLREISRQSRRLAKTILSDSERCRLTVYADEMDDAARRMEKGEPNSKPFGPTRTMLGAQ
jgi:hypothetical protein